MRKEKYITLAHGNGGRFMRSLIEDIFSRHLKNPHLDVQTDAVILPKLDGDFVFSVDGFTVQPLEFPGGDIGSLAVHGTVNDLAVSGAKPLYLSLSAIIEEGLEFDKLEQYVKSIADAAKQAGVVVVTGDTKVVPKGFGGGVYFTTSGIGEQLANCKLGMNQIRVGDKIIISGSVGDHGTCVMLAREEFGLKGDLKSDSACVLPVTEILMKFKGLHFMRDPTRGGLATVAHEIAVGCNFSVRLLEENIPVKLPVRSVCEMLGYDPYYLACEGRVVAFVSADEAEQAVDALQQHANSRDAVIIGEVEAGNPNVILQTEFGGERVLEELEDDPLPRIC